MTPVGTTKGSVPLNNFMGAFEAGYNVANNRKDDVIDKSEFRISSRQD